MTTITLEYNERNKIARQMIDFILSVGIVKRKRTGLEEALEDLENGRVRTIHKPHTPKAK